MDQWLMNDAIATRVTHHMLREGWLQLTKRDLLFKGDMLFIRGGKRKDLMLVNIRKSARKDAYKLWHKYKDQADVLYASATYDKLISTPKRCRAKRYIIPSALRRLRSMR